MKLKLKLLSFFLVSTFLIAHAQSVRLTVGKQEKKKALEGLIGIVGTTENGFYTLRTKTKGFAPMGIGIGVKGKMFIDYYDNSLTLIKSIEVQEIEMEILNKAKKSFEFFAQDASNNLYLYYSEASNTVNTLNRLKLDLNSNVFNDKEEVSTQDYYGKKSDRRGTYEAYQSADKSKTAIVSFASGKDDNTLVIYIEVLGKNLESLWKKEMEFPVKIKQDLSKVDYLSMYSSSSMVGFKNTITCLLYTSDAADE